MAGKYSRKERRLIEKGIEYANKEWLRRLSEVQHIKGIGPTTLLKIYETLGVMESNPERQAQIQKEAERNENSKRNARGNGGKEE